MSYTRAPAHTHTRAHTVIVDLIGNIVGGGHKLTSEECLDFVDMIFDQDGVFARARARARVCVSVCARARPGAHEHTRAHSHPTPPDIYLRTHAHTHTHTHPRR